MFTNLVGSLSQSVHIPVIPPSLLYDGNYSSSCSDKAEFCGNQECQTDWPLSQEARRGEDPKHRVPHQTVSKDDLQCLQSVKTQFAEFIPSLQLKLTANFIRLAWLSRVHNSNSLDRNKQTIHIQILQSYMYIKMVSWIVFNRCYNSLLCSNWIHKFRSTLHTNCIKS